MRFLTLALLLLLTSPAYADHGWPHDPCEDREEECHSVPEIDGAALPKAILLMVSLYIVASASMKRRG
jgi:hypothetical protein